MARIVVCISGASGIILAHHLVATLISLGHLVELIISRDAVMTIHEELGEELASPQKFVQSFEADHQKNITLYSISDFRSRVASGSAPFDACIVIPCSMATLGAIASGISDNLIRRVADVALKERRKLVLVTREAPLHEIHLENMLKLSRLGACIFPPQPAWYLHPKNLRDVELVIVQRILDQIGINTSIAPRWE